MKQSSFKFKVNLVLRVDLEWAIYLFLFGLQPKLRWPSSLFCHNIPEWCFSLFSLSFWGLSLLLALYLLHCFSFPDRPVPSACSHRHRQDAWVCVWHSVKADRWETVQEAWHSTPTRPRVESGSAVEWASETGRMSLSTSREEISPFCQLLQQAGASSVNRPLADLLSRSTASDV